MGPSQGLIRLPVHMKRQFLRALNGAMLQAWENTSYLDYYDRQLWDLVEVMLQDDGNGRPSVSHTVSMHIHTMLRGREFARPTHTELVDVLELWSKIFQDQYSAFDQRVLCCLRSTFSDFLADQARYMQRGIDEGLKVHRAPDGFCEECPICAEEVQPGEYLTTLSPFCTHWFHSECIETWFEKSNDGNTISSTCPMCRAKIDVNW